SPYLRDRWPKPPPRVRPATPVVEMIPQGVARPNWWVAWSTSAQVQPPSTRTVRRGINPDLAQAGEVDDDAAVTDGPSGDVVAAATDRQEQVVLPREIHRVDHVGDTGAADDQGRAPVDHGVVDLAGRVVAGVAGPDHRAAQPRCECGHRAGVE